MALVPEKLFAELPELKNARRVILALSGGLDSVVLLCCLRLFKNEQNPPWQLSALHINHGISKFAGDWEIFCQQLCRNWSVPLETVRLQLDDVDGSGLEARARTARYQVFAEKLEAGDFLLLAHHGDDQLETLLLHLMRGSGVGGLSGMPQRRALGKGIVLRPLLALPRAALLQFAEAQGLEWVDDESNADTRFDRNFCRHQLLPLIESRWPSYRDSWHKTRQLSKEAALLLEELAVMDLAGIVGEHEYSIELEPLLKLSEARQRNVLRHWLRTLGVFDVSWNFLQRLSSEIIPARDDSPAVLPGPGVRVQRHQKRLYALRELSVPESVNVVWSPYDQPRLELPNNGVLLCSEASQGLRLHRNESLTVQYRRGGESCQLHRRPHKTLKRILQEAGVHPWLRDRLPLVYSANKLVCIPNVGIAEGYIASASEPGVSISWQAPDLRPGAG